MKVKGNAAARHPETEFRRKLSTRYQKVQQNWTREIDRLHALFLAQGLTTVTRNDLITGDLRKEAVKMLGGIEREEAEYLTACLDLHHHRTQALFQQIKKETDGDEVMQRLQSVPGVGPVLALAFVSQVAFERFQDRGQVSNYLGLTPDSNTKYGKVKGNDNLRNLLVQAALAVARSEDGGTLKDRFEYLTQEKSKNEMQAVLAIARQIAELLYTITREGRDYEARPSVHVR